jgi:tRNA-uridine 2-sulfurtransferase
VDVDVAGATVTIGPLEDLLVAGVVVDDVTWTQTSVDLSGELLVQLSAHGEPVLATAERVSAPAEPVGGDPGPRAVVAVCFSTPQRRVAPGQSVVLYRGDEVLGGGTAGAPTPIGPSRVVTPRP